MKNGEGRYAFLFREENEEGLWYSRHELKGGKTSDQEQKEGGGG